MLMERIFMAMRMLLERMRGRSKSRAPQTGAPAAQRFLLLLLILHLMGHKAQRLNHMARTLQTLHLIRR
jgi:hypothetical protein